MSQNSYHLQIILYQVTTFRQHCISLGFVPTVYSILEYCEKVCPIDIDEEMKKEVLDLIVSTELECLKYSESLITTITKDPVVEKNSSREIKTINFC